jgi:hypothetical protein
MFKDFMVAIAMILIVSFLTTHMVYSFIYDSKPYNKTIERDGKKYHMVTGPLNFVLVECQGDSLHKKD